jgi:hypothetical protein
VSAEEVCKLNGGQEQRREVSTGEDEYASARPRTTVLPVFNKTTSNTKPGFSLNLLPILLFYIV